MRTLVLFLFVSLNALAQDTITVVHKAYKTTYDKVKNYPAKVEWWVSKSNLVCDNKVKRGDKFIPDPKLNKETNLQEAYTGSGFDELMAQVANEESFFFSNMTAQYPALNRGDWKTLEMFTRELALKNDSVKVWCGSVGEVKKIGNVSVPSQCWKVIYIKKTNEWFAYLFTNSPTKADGIENNKVSKTDIERLTKFNFTL